jgi:hypothetical protein
MTDFAQGVIVGLLLAYTPSFVVVAWLLRRGRRDS